MNKYVKKITSLSRFLRYHKIVSLRHLQSINMTYTEHFKHSLTFSFLFTKSSFYAISHAIIPSTHIKSTTNTMKQIFNQLENPYRNKN